jgi:hypothetical protein
VLQLGEFNSTLANRLIHVYFSYILCFLFISVFPSFPFHFAISLFILFFFSRHLSSSCTPSSTCLLSLLSTPFGNKTPLNHSFLASSLV